MSTYGSGGDQIPAKIARIKELRDHHHQEAANSWNLRVRSMHMYHEVAYELALLILGVRTQPEPGEDSE